MITFLADTLTWYRNDSKFSDRQAWANSIDPRGAVWSTSTWFAIPSAFEYRKIPK